MKKRLLLVVRQILARQFIRLINNIRVFHHFFLIILVFLIIIYF